MSQPAERIGPAYEVVHDGLDREAWLHARSFGIGASEVPVLFGLVSWMDPLTLYALKRGEVAREEPEDDQLLEWGHSLEGGIIEYLRRRTGEDIQRNKRLLRSTEHPWLVATPDAIVDPGGGDEPCEVKVQSYGYDETEWEDGIPQRYAVQCQSQMIVMNRPRCLFGTTVWGKPPVWCWYQWDDVLARQIIYKTQRFWECVKNGTPPESDGSDRARKTALRLAEKQPETVELYRSDIDELLDQWQVHVGFEASNKVLAKEHEIKRKTIEDELILKMGSAQRAITADGWVFQKTRQERHNKPKPASVTIVEGFKVYPPKE